MKVQNIILLIGILVICLCGIVSGNEYPTLTGYTNDYANILTPQEVSNLNNRISIIENDTSVEIALVTIQSTNGESLAQYATKVGDKNGVGKKNTDNGIVVLVSFENERGIFIATGKGIENVITDTEVNTIYLNSKSYFSNKQYHMGFTSILDGIEKELKKDDSVTTAPIPDAPSTDNVLPIMITFAGIVGFIILGIIFFAISHNDDGSYYITSTVERPRNRSKRRERLSESLSSAAAMSVLSSTVSTYHSHDDDDDSSSDSSSSFDGGFGGFGGGGFGGGGSGGSF